MADWQLPLCDTVNETNQNIKHRLYSKWEELAEDQNHTEGNLKLDLEGNINNPGEKTASPNHMTKSESSKATSPIEGSGRQ